MFEVFPKTFEGQPYKGRFLCKTERAGDISIHAGAFPVQHIYKISDKRTENFPDVMKLFRMRTRRIPERS